MPGGNVGDGVVLDLTRLTGTDWTRGGAVAGDAATGAGLAGVRAGVAGVRAGAGVVANVLDVEARTRGHSFPALPSSAPWCTVGGMVSTDAAGARSFRFGPTHDWIEALQVVHASGHVERLNRGDGQRAPVWSDLLDSMAETRLPDRPPLHKNSSGYALQRFCAEGDPIQLVAGSEGTLVVVTEATLRPEPLPAHRGVALLGLPHLSELPSLVAEVRRLGGNACEYFGLRLLELGGLLEDPRLDPLETRCGALLVEFSGSRGHVADGLAGLAAAAGSAGGMQSSTDPTEAEALWTLRHGASPAIAHAAGRRRSVQFIEDCVVPVAGLATFVEGVEAALARQGWEGVVFGHAGDGNLHVNPLVDLEDPEWRVRVLAILDEVVDLVVSLGGTLSGEHGDGRIRAPYLDRIWSRAHLEAFRRAKDALDPRGVLNPGVILPLARQDPLRGFAAGPDLQRRTAPVEGR